MRKVISALAAFALAAGLFLVGSAPATAADVICIEKDEWGNCVVEVPVPGDDGDDQEIGGPSNPGPGGPSACYVQQIEVPCVVDGAVLVSSYGCYLRVMDPQPDLSGPGDDGPLDPNDPDLGAWYDCFYTSLHCLPTDGYFPCPPVPIWIEDPPAGVQISPEQAAAAVAARLEIHAIEIGMAPKVNPEWGHRRTHVGVPVWMWVANPGPTTYDGYSVSDSEGGMTVTGTVSVSSIEWNMGDGETVVCGTAGQAYQTGFGWAHSPDCGHLYSKTSKSQPNDRYTVTATSRWVFNWEAGNQTGTIELDVSSSELVEVNEMQTVNVTPNG